MPKKNINAKEILADIKAGMDNAALMEKYQLTEKGLQSLFKKLVDAGVLKQKQGEPEKRGPEPEKMVEVAWKCPACGKPQTRQSDVCPDCGVIVAKFREAGAPQLSEQAVENNNTEIGSEDHPEGRKAFQDFLGRIYETTVPVLEKAKTITRKPHVAAIAGASIVLVVMAVFFGLQKRGGESVQSKDLASNPGKASVESNKTGLPKEIEETVLAHYGSMPPQLFDEFFEGQFYIGVIRPSKVRILKGEVGVPTKEIIEKINPRNMWCVRLAVDTEWGRIRSEDMDTFGLDFQADLRKRRLLDSFKRSGDVEGAIKFYHLWGLSFNQSSEGLFNVIVQVSQSGKITGSDIDGDSLYSGNNCPQDWDNICPFGCK